MERIYINSGHSNTDPGAVGHETERVLNVKVSEYMNEYLLANYVCETRMNPGTMLTLTEVCNDANAWGADLFVSIHFNAGGGDGFECYVYSKSRVPLGEIFAKYVKEAGQNLRYPDTTDMPMGVKIRPGLYVLKNTTMPAILNEGAFVDNLKDIQDWNDDVELKKLSIAYAKAAAEFLNLKKKEGYTLSEFVSDIQKALGATVTGVADDETLHKTVTVSATWNRSHAVVKPIQKRLHALGYTEVGAADGIAGSMFTSALGNFQQENACYVSGELVEWCKTWYVLLGML